MESPKVSLCMIVKNEENNLGPCLESVKGLFDEIIIVDTGSTDRTKEIALEYAAKISDFEWIDDFSAARNKSFELATGQWIFWIDADHRIDQENYQKLKSLFSELNDEKIAYQMYEISLFTGQLTTGLHARLFLRNSKIRWQYRVHEQIILSLLELGYELKTVPIVIYHFGYFNSNTLKQKILRNIRLLELDQKENPNDLSIIGHTLFHLSRSYRSIDRADLALPLILKAIEITPKNPPINNQLYYRHIVELIEVYFSLKLWEEALNTCQMGEQLMPQLADLLYWESLIWEKLGNFPNAQSCLHKLLDNSEFETDDLDLNNKIRYSLGTYYYKQGNEKEAEKLWLELIEMSPYYPFSWLALIDLQIGQNRWEEALIICNKARDLMPLLGDIIYKKSLIFEKLKQFAEAKSSLLELQQSSQPFQFLNKGLTSTHIKHYLGMISFKQGDFLDAEHQWRAAVDEDPSDIHSWLSLAELWILQNRPSEITKAISYLEKSQKQEIANAIRTHQKQFQKESSSPTTILKKFISEETEA